MLHDRLIPTQKNDALAMYRTKNSLTMVILATIRMVSTSKNEKLGTKIFDLSCFSRSHMSAMLLKIIKPEVLSTRYSKLFINVKKLFRS